MADKNIALSWNGQPLKWNNTVVVSERKTRFPTDNLLYRWEFNGNTNASFGSPIPWSVGGGITYETGLISGGLAIRTNDDVLNIADPTIRTSIDGDDFSLSFWFKNNEVSGSPYVWQLAPGGDSSPYPRYQMTLDMTLSLINVHINDNTYGDTYNGAWNITDLNDWHHIVFSYNKLAVDTYLDSVLIMEGIWNHNMTGTSGMSLGLARRNENSTEYDMDFDNLYFYQRKMVLQFLEHLKDLV